jgi:hypothetical protein
VSIDVYTGFQVEEKVLENAPRDIEEAARFYSVLLDEHVTAEDIAVFGHIRNKFHSEECMVNQDMGSAWFEVYVAHKLHKVTGALCGIRYLAQFHGIHLHVEEGIGGRTDDKGLMRTILEALGLNPDAAEIMDCMYWG